jgi:hypothetical protein
MAEAAAIYSASDLPGELGHKISGVSAGITSRKHAENRTDKQFMHLGAYTRVQRRADPGTMHLNGAQGRTD